MSLNLGINVGLTNEEYHAEKEHISSSNLKLLLDSPAEFYRQKILGQKPLKPIGTQTAMDIGTYVHTLILEPESLDKEFAFYKGWAKRGEDFKSFKEANPNKIIISEPQAHTGQRLAKSVEACPAGLELLKGGLAELSIASKLLGVPVKMRADYINPAKRYILDVKTTRHPNESHIFRQTVKQLGYELSAALYCDIAHQEYGCLFDFYWLVISKADFSAVVYKASSSTLTEGTGLVNQALVTYKKCLEAGVWPESLSEVSKSAANLEIEEI